MRRPEDVKSLYDVILGIEIGMSSLLFADYFLRLFGELAGGAQVHRKVNHCGKANSLGGD